MKSKLKKLLLLGVLFYTFTCLAVAPASAFIAPVLIKAASWPLRSWIQASLYAHLGVGYALSDREIANIDEAGMVQRPSTLVYIEAKDLPGADYKVPTVVEKDVNAKIAYPELKTLVDKKNPDGSYKYPGMRDAIIKMDNDIKSISEAQAGDYANTPYGVRLVDRVTTSPEWDGLNNMGTTSWSPSYYLENGGANSAYPGFHTQTYKEFHDAGVPPLVESARLPEEVKNTIGSASQNPAPIGSTALQDEIDKMLQDPDYVPKFTDATTGLPPDIPADVLTPAQLKAANEYVQKQQAAAQSAYAAEVLQSAAIQSQIDAASAAAASTAAQQASNSDPTNSSLAQAATAAAAAAASAAAQAARDAAAAAGAASNAAGAAAAAAGAPGGEIVGGGGIGGEGIDDEDELINPNIPQDNSYDASVTGQPDKKSIGDLLRSAFQSSPLVSMVQSFSVSLTDPVSILHIGNIYGQDLSFDFSPWEGTLRACGGVLIIIMHGYCVLIVIRGW